MARAANLWNLLLVLLMSVLLGACGAGERAEAPNELEPVELPPPVSVEPEPQPRPEPGMRDGEPGVSRHAWDFLTRMDGEDEGFGMYTYVLFARRVDHAGLAADVEERYEKVLAAIAGTTLNLPELGELEPREKRTTNLLYVPALAPGREPTLANYNSPLALRYLAEIGRMCRERSPEIAERFDRRPGPFLISLAQPVGEVGTEDVNLLYADLSTTNPVAMRDVVTAYKARLARDAVNEDEKFTSLRLSLLNLILNADDNLRLVKVAMAEWVPQ